MARAFTRYTRWKIFLDGVEVPYLNFAVQVGVDSAGSASIELPPDPLLLQLRPRTVVHIFMLDEFENSGGDKMKDKQAYKLFWEGEVEAIKDTKTPRARAFSIEAEGVLSILSRYKTFMTGIGMMSQTPLVTGSTLFYSEPGADPTSLLSMTICGEAFSTERDEEANTGKEASFRNSKTPNYAERLLRLLVYFASRNAALRLQLARTNLFGKIAGVPDRLLTHLVPRILASQYFEQAGQGVAQDSTVLDVASILNRKVYYHFSGFTAPAFPVDQPKTGEEGLIAPVQDKLDSLFAIGRPYYRNDYALLPETYYAIPPSCNLIFPEMIESFSFARVFSQEPTRALLVDTQLGSNMAVMAPDAIFRYEELKKAAKGQRPNPEDMWAFNWSGLKGGGQVSKSPYLTPEDFNLLSAITDGEIEKGIIPVMSYPPSQLFSGLVNLLDLEDQDKRDQAVSYLKSIGVLSADISGTENADKAFMYIMKTLADYNLTLTKFTRRASISLSGHRWLAPGFPAVVLMKEGSYLCWVKSHAFSVDADGQETSQVELDYVRALPATNVSLVKAIETASEASLEISKLVDSLKKEYDSWVASFKEKVAKIVRVDGIVALLRRQINTPGHPLKEAAIAEYERRLDAFVNLYRSYVGLARAIVDVTELETAYITWTADDPTYFNTTLKASLAAIERTAETNKEGLDSAKGGNIPDASDMGNSKIAEGLTKLRSLVETVMDSLSGSSSAPGSGIESSSLENTFAFPGLFANEDLISVDTSDELYYRLLGAQKKFSELAARANIPELSVTYKGMAEGSMAVALKNRQAYAKFLKFLFALGKIFPIDSSTTGTEWEERAVKSDRYESVRTWEEKEILRRERLHALGDFLTANRLKLSSYLSDPPTAISFYVLEPEEKPLEYTSASGKKLSWDDTIFSRIVDEFRLQPRSIEVTREVMGSTVTDTISQKTDTEIVKLRKSVRDPFLTTKARQELIVAYSRKHFGARGHDGT